MPFGLETIQKNYFEKNQSFEKIDLFNCALTCHKLDGAGAALAVHGQEAFGLLLRVFWWDWAFGYPISRKIRWHPGTPRGDPHAHRPRGMRNVEKHCRRFV